MRRRAEVDKRCLLTYPAWDPGASLRKLGQLVSELAVAFYRDEGRRVKVRACSRFAHFLWLRAVLSSSVLQVTRTLRGAAGAAVRSSNSISVALTRNWPSATPSRYAQCQPCVLDRCVLAPQN